MFLCLEGLVLVLHVKQNSALERQQQPLVVSQAKTVLPHLAVTVVANVDDRSAIGPVSSTVSGKQ